MTLIDCTNTYKCAVSARTAADGGSAIAEGAEQQACWSATTVVQDVLRDSCLHCGQAGAAD